MQGLATLPFPFFSRAQRSEIFHRLGHVVPVQSHLYSARAFAVDVDVEEHLLRHRLVTRLGQVALQQIQPGVVDIFLLRKVG